MVWIPSASKSCRTLVRTACRTRGGLVCFSHNNDMRRHGWLWLKQTKPDPSGVEARSDSGVVFSRLQIVWKTSYSPIERLETTSQRQPHCIRTPWEKRKDQLLKCFRQTGVKPFGGQHPNLNGGNLDRDCSLHSRFCGSPDAGQQSSQTVQKLL